MMTGYNYFLGEVKIWEQDNLQNILPLILVLSCLVVYVAPQIRNEYE